MEKYRSKRTWQKKWNEKNNKNMGHGIAEIANHGDDDALSYKMSSVLGCAFRL